MKKASTLIARPYTVTELQTGQFRLGDDRVLLYVSEEDMTVPLRVELYNNRKAVNLFIVGDNNIKCGDKFLAPNCINESFSEKIVTYLRDVEGQGNKNLIMVKLESGEELMTTNTLFIGARKVLATSDQIPFNTEGKINLTEDIFFHGGDCRLEMDGDKPILAGGKVVISQPLSLIPEYHKSRSFTCEELIEMTGKEFNLTGEEVRIEKCYLYNAKKVKVRGIRGVSVFIDFFDKENKNILTLPVMLDTCRLHVYNITDVLFEVIKMK